MRGYTHFASGIFLGVVLYSSPVAVAEVALGAVFPDLDAPFSKISCLARIRKNKGSALKHRGILHTVTAASLIYGVYFLLFQNNAIVPFLLGYLLHIFLDSFTPMGIKPFYPLSKIKFRMPGPNVKTGSAEDRALGTVFSILAVVFIFLRLFLKR